MALKPTTIRFAADTMVLIREAAGEVGSTVSQFVREAAIMRALLVNQRSEGDFAHLAQQVRVLARNED